METLIEYLIPVFVIGTVLMLVLGLYGLFRGGDFNRNWSNKLMRARVLFQFIAVILVLAALFLTGNRPDWLG